jgi:hypothetical protein
MATWNAVTGRAGPQIIPSGLNEDTGQAFASLDVLAGISAGLLLPGHGEPSPGPRRPGAHSHSSVPSVVIRRSRGLISRQPRPRGG